MAPIADAMGAVALLIASSKLAKAASGAAMMKAMANTRPATENFPLRLCIIIPHFITRYGTTVTGTVEIWISDEATLPNSRRCVLDPPVRPTYI